MGSENFNSTETTHPLPKPSINKPKISFPNVYLGNQTYITLTSKTKDTAHSLEDASNVMFLASEIAICFTSKK